MKIIALKPFAGTEISLAEGAEATVSDAFGKDMIQAGYAKEVSAKKAEKPVESEKKTTRKTTKKD